MHPNTPPLTINYGLRSTSQKWVEHIVRSGVALGADFESPAGEFRNADVGENYAAIPPSNDLCAMADSVTNIWYQ